MTNGDTHTIFYGYSGSTAVLRLDFRDSGGAYQIQLRALDNSTSWNSTAWYTISDAPHTIEFDWQASSGAGANNGSLGLWVDGMQVASLTSINNDTRRIDKIRLGPVTGIDAGTSGTEYFDAFASYNQAALPTPTSTPTATNTPTSMPTDTPTSTPTPTDTATPVPATPVTITYTYDALYRLKEASYSTGDNYAYTYDEVGNRRTQIKTIGSQVTTDTYVYDDANRLSSVNGIPYAWDNNGNLRSDGVKNYGYDAANRLITINAGPSLSATYAYSGLGDRLRQTVDGLRPVVRTPLTSSRCARAGYRR